MVDESEETDRQKMKRRLDEYIRDFPGEAIQVTANGRSAKMVVFDPNFKIALDGLFDRPFQAYLVFDDGKVVRSDECFLQAVKRHVYPGKATVEDCVIQFNPAPSVHWDLTEEPEEDSDV